MYEVGKSLLNSIVHYWHKLDNLLRKSGKLCWYCNGHSATQNNLRNKLSKCRIRYLLMQFVEVWYV